MTVLAFELTICVDIADRSLPLHPFQPLAARYLHSTSRFLKDNPPNDEIRDPPRSERPPSTDDSSQQSSDEQQSTGSASDEANQEKQSQGSKKDSKGKDGPPPPPPPHGDKTPWQVFTDTLRSEFQASKEWNESTKALASSANQLTEAESIKRARAAYQAASGAASSTTSSALRHTGKALGKGAAWTWDTPVVKGVRVGVSVTGKVIEKGTRPVRETEVYKKAVGEVKEVIDDGSSSRYGGWTEKEERRRQRELRELNEAKATGRSSKRVEKMEEDPKCVT